MHKKSYLYRLTHHLRTIFKHHREVRKNCFACGLYRQGIMHDLSKLSPAELFPSIKYYEGTRSPYSYEKEKYGYKGVIIMKRASLDDMLTGKESRYALVIGVAKRAREIADEFKEEGVITEDKPVLLAIDDFKNHKYNILEED